MSTAEIRRAKWEEIAAWVHGARQEALAAWEAHGPGTTREVAARAGMDILTFRPRTTELLQVGFLRLEGKERGQGVYAARPREEVREEIQREAAAIAAGDQMILRL